MLCLLATIGTKMSTHVWRCLPSVCDERWTAASDGDESGCTLIVALLVDDLVVVANAGELARTFSECSANSLPSLVPLDLPRRLPRHPVLRQRERGER